MPMGSTRHGRGVCPSCDGVGRFAVYCCPLDADGMMDALATIEASDLFYKGLPPMAGGTLDQVRAFVQAARFVRSEQARIRAEKKLIPGLDV